jgi:hypothetical protein
MCGSRPAMGQVWPRALKRRLNFEINFPRMVGKGFGKLPYRAGRAPAAVHGPSGNFWKIGEIFESFR